MPIVGSSDAGAAGLGHAVCDPPPVFGRHHRIEDRVLLLAGAPGSVVDAFERQRARPAGHHLDGGGRCRCRHRNRTASRRTGGSGFARIRLQLQRPIRGGDSALVLDFQPTVRLRILRHDGLAGRHSSGAGESPTATQHPVPGRGSCPRFRNGDGGGPSVTPGFRDRCRLAARSPLSSSDPRARPGRDRRPPSPQRVHRRLPLVEQPAGAVRRLESGCFRAGDRTPRPGHRQRRQRS